MYRKEKTEELIRKLAAEFLEKETGPQSLVTVINTEFDVGKNSALILISVMPPEKSKEAIDFVNRKTGEFRKYLHDHSRIGRLPFIKFRLI